MAFFCTVTGKRIAAPGVWKDVDPVNGHNEFSETQGHEPAMPKGGKPAAESETPETKSPKGGK